MKISEAFQLILSRQKSYTSTLITTDSITIPYPMEILSSWISAMCRIVKGVDLCGQDLGGCLQAERQNKQSVETGFPRLSARALWWCMNTSAAESASYEIAGNNLCCSKRMDGAALPAFQIMSKAAGVALSRGADIRAPELHALEPVK